MTWEEALETAVAQTGHERFRWLCSDENPDRQRREGCRRYVLEKAGVKPEYPPLMTQARNAMGAAVRFVRSGGKQVDPVEHERRLTICYACEHYDAEQKRCRLCGCVARWKARLASEHCPDKPPRW